MAQQSKTRSIEEILLEVEKGALRPFYIFHGRDDFRTSKAAEQVAFKLIPEKERAFNLVRFEANEIDLSAVFAELNSFALFSGKKVVWLRGVELGATKSDASAPLKRAISQLKQGKSEAAVSSLALAIKRSGADPAPFRGMSIPEREASLKELFSESTTADDIRGFARALSVAEEREELLVPKDDEPLEQLIASAEKGWHKQHILIISSGRLNQNLKTVKRLSELGVVALTDVEEPSSYFSDNSDELKAILNQYSSEAGVNLTPPAVELFIDRIDLSESRLVVNELEKLRAYASGETVTLEAVEKLTVTTREDPFYEVTTAIAERKLKDSLVRVAALFTSNERELDVVLPFIGALAGEFRRLMRARIVMEKLGGYSASMSYPAFQSYVGRIEDKGVWITGSDKPPKPGYLLHIFKRASQFNIEELKKVIVGLHQLDKAVKSSPISPRLAVERFVFSVCVKEG